MRSIMSPVESEVGMSVSGDKWKGAMGCEQGGFWRNVRQRLQ